MNSEEKEKQDKTLARLQWLNERVKPDFRGNPPPFEAKKTLRSVEQRRRASVRARVGDTDFLPFWHGATPLALDATRCDYIQPENPAPCSRSGAPQRPPYGAQAIDPATGLTEVQLALSWNVPHAPSTLPVRTSFSQIDSGRLSTRVTRDASYMRSLTPAERAAVCRQHALEHPMRTLESSRTHDNRWRAATQLGDPVVKPRRPLHNTALEGQNSIRVVHILRST